MIHYRETFVVGPNEVDDFGFISIPMLQKKIQTASDQHGYLLGFGFEDMNKIGLFWVVSRLMVEIIILPKQSEEITIETWLEAPTSAGINRFYVLTDSFNHEIVKGMAKWSLVSRETLKLVKMADYDFITTLEFESDSPVFKFSGLKRIPRQHTFEINYSVERQVQKKEIDFNNHVNNTYYIQYIQDAIQKDMQMEMYQITYTYPLYESDIIEMNVYISGKQTIVEGYAIKANSERQLSFQGLVMAI